MREEYQPGVGLAAGSLMLKWEVISDRLRSETFLPGEKVNIFVNLESVMHQLQLSKHLDMMFLNFKQKVVLEIESSILNLLANYRAYFRRAKCKVKTYLFVTDLTGDDQVMKLFNPYYRSYYRNLYLKNPEHKVIGELMTEYVIPELELILSYIPNCYLVRTGRFDGSLVPALIAERKRADHNLVVTGDPFDTLYLFRPKFDVFLIKRRYANFKLITSVEESVASILKGEPVINTRLMTSELYYRLLLTVLGSKVRNVQAPRGFGPVRLMNALHEGIDTGSILPQFTSVDSVIEVFPVKYRDELTSAVKCIDLDGQLVLVTKADREATFGQLIDRSDPTSLEALNNQRYLEVPINLQGLLD